MARKWTDDQLEAIRDGENDLLVSAAAGSGKTAVLVERITRLILEEHVPVTNMLVVTFTKAAASEMRERIRTSLRDALAAGGDPETEAFLREQLSDLFRAGISNFHSFAASLLREFFAVAGIDPAFRIADDLQAGLLRTEALDELFEQRFSETGPRKDAFLSYLRAYGTSRSEDAVRSQILTLHTFLESLPDPDRWLTEAAAFPDMTAQAFYATGQYAFLASDVQSMLGEAIEAAEKLIRLLEENDAYRDNLLPQAVRERAMLEGLSASFARSFEDAYAAFRSASFDRFAARSKAEKAAYAIDRPYASSLRARYRELFDLLKKTYFMRPPEDAVRLMRETAPYCAILTELVREFRTLYRARKDREKLLDFSDLESYALRVLADDAARETLRKRFRYIFVDECQDTNRVQEEFVSRLKSDENRLFFVGDVKQSIYRFRLAEPALFNARAIRYGASYDARRNGLPAPPERRIDLNRNFRSEGSVLSAVNALFETLMEPSVSGIVYDDTHRLIPGTEAAAAARTPVELHLIDSRKPETSGDSSGNSTVPNDTPIPSGDSADSASAADESVSDAPEADLKRAEAEAVLAASLIHDAIGKPYTDFASGEERILRPCDVAILLRAGTSASVFENALLDAGIPALSDTGESYYDTVEIAIFLRFLEVIDNLHRDEALIAVLHSPLFRFTADELAAIRIARPTGSYADALLAAAGSQSESTADAGASVPSDTGDASASGDTEHDMTSSSAFPDAALRSRVSAFLAAIDHARNRLRFLPLSDFLWELMLDTGYYHYVGALPNGMLRQANLRALTEKAAAYEAGGGKGLPGWIRYVAQMKRSNLQVPQVRPAAGGDAVRIMTIHKSKGLEFPYVLLAETGKAMKLSDPGDVQFRAEGVLALPYVNKDLRVRSRTILSSILQRRAAREERAEELRVLYVAMTRPKHKLVLLGTPRADDLNAYEAGLPPLRGSVTGAASYLDWLLGSAAFRKEIGAPVVHRLNDLSASRAGASRTSPLAASSLRNGFGGLPDTPELARFRCELDRRLNWTYPYREAADMPSKLSVTEINRRSEGKAPYRIPLAVPAFARTEEASFSGAQKGTFLHRVMEHIPFRTDWTEASIRSFIEDMTAREFFTAEEAAVIPPDRILRFFTSDLGRRAVLAAESGLLFRETDFTLALPAGGTVQGTIDLFFRDEAGRWILVDYKSNYLDESDSAEDALLETYRSQLVLYRDALEAIRGLTVSEVYLYAFSTGRAIPLPEENTCRAAENRR